MLGRTRHLGVCRGEQPALLPVGAAAARRVAREQHAAGDADARPADGYRLSAEQLGDFETFNVYEHMRDDVVKVKKGMHGPGSAAAHEAFVRMVAVARTATTETAVAGMAAGMAAAGAEARAAALWEGSWALILSYARLVCHTMDDGMRPQDAAATVARRTARLAAGDAR